MYVRLKTAKTPYCRYFGPGPRICTSSPKGNFFFEGLPKNPKNSAKKLYVVGVPENAENFHYMECPQNSGKKSTEFWSPHNNKRKILAAADETAVERCTSVWRMAYTDLPKQSRSPRRRRHSISALRSTGKKPHHSSLRPKPRSLQVRASEWCALRVLLEREAVEVGLRARGDEPPMLLLLRARRDETAGRAPRRGEVPPPRTPVPSSHTSACEQCRVAFEAANCRYRTNCAK